jgi:uncharacterized protein (DUF2126 family)
MLRARHLFLSPGDSPIGLRLPLQSLPWEPADQIEELHTLDPMAPVERLPVPQRMLPSAPLRRKTKQRARPWEAPPAPVKDPGAVVRTAFAIEPREGRLCVFLPPVTSAEEYVELVTAIEDTAARLEMPVIIEGYAPPYDARLQHVKVTPDPGVIEVNLQPAANWKELVENTTALYENARLSRLGTEKFMLDGRHTGTGG